MRIGIPTEIKADESRVAITPSGVAAFTARGHEVVVEAGAGLFSTIPDRGYRAAGASVVEGADAVWERADLILKVKEPLEPEFDRMRPGQILFTYLHLAASRDLTEKLLERRVVGIGYETVQLADGTLPLLVPMSEVAGRLSIQAGATSLEMRSGGKGLLLPGVSGVRRGRVTILGAGVVGLNACVVGVGFGADVTIVDINPLRLAYVRDVVQGHVTTLMSNAANIEGAVASADLLVCSVLIPGARTPRLVTRAHLAQMEPGSAIVDVAVDQGGCAETSRPTTHHDPRYVEEDVVHYCVANMPGAVPHTSTYALTNATTAYALALADHGWRAAAERQPALAKGVNVVDGQVTHAAVAAAHGLGVNGHQKPRQSEQMVDHNILGVWSGASSDKGKSGRRARSRRQGREPRESGGGAQRRALTPASTRGTCRSDDAPATTTSCGRHESRIRRFLAVANTRPRSAGRDIANSNARRRVLR